MSTQKKQRLSRQLNNLQQELHFHFYASWDRREILE